MLIRKVMNSIGFRNGGSPREVVMLAPEQTVLEAARLLAENNIGVVLVCGPDKELVGILSERDIVRGINVHKDAAVGMRVAELMTREPVTCGPEDEAGDVVRRMKEGGFRHMPVVEAGRAIGMVSSTDVLRYLATTLTSKQREELWSVSFWL